jgi:hypothetical protein
MHKARPFLAISLGIVVAYWNSAVAESRDAYSDPAKISWGKPSRLLIKGNLA